MAYKISIIGDVMNESALGDTCKKADGSYDYSAVFAPLKGILSKADYRIANLETPIAGEALTYSSSYYSFNAPESLVEAIMDIGINAVSTANNHAADRCAGGFYNTIKTLDRMGLPHTGTYMNADEKNRNLYFNLGDTRFAMIAYTYSVNFWKKQGIDTGLENGQVNFLRNPLKSSTPLNFPESLNNAVKYLNKVTGYTLQWWDVAMLQKFFDLPVPYPDYDKIEGLEDYIARLKADYEEARKNADIVLFVPHIGGQFNTEPGEFSDYYIKKAISMGFDAVFAAHSHTSQKACLIDGKPAFYSLGNVSMSARTPYAQPQTLPNYGVIAHIYVENKKIVKTTYSLFDIYEKGDEQMRVVPVNELYAKLKSDEEKAKLEKEVAEIVKRVSGKTLCGADAIKEEYDL